MTDGKEEFFFMAHMFFFDDFCPSIRDVIFEQHESIPKKGSRKNQCHRNKEYISFLEDFFLGENSSPT